MNYFVICGIINGKENVLDFACKDDSYFFRNTSFDHIHPLAKFKSVGSAKIAIKNNPYIKAKTYIREIEVRSINVFNDDATIESDVDIMERIFAKLSEEDKKYLKSKGV